MCPDEFEVRHNDAHGLSDILRLKAGLMQYPPHRLPRLADRFEFDAAEWSSRTLSLDTLLTPLATRAVTLYRSRRVLASVGMYQRKLTRMTPTSSKFYFAWTIIAFK
jgi:hypothetical protein